jgi:hypothetical protein
VVDTLDNGTPCYAPIGVMVIDGALAQCHLCGRWFRSVGCHIRAHGWDRTDYRAAFGLERRQPLEGAETRDRRAAAMRARRVFEPAVRDGCAIGQKWLRSGELTRAAADVARHRRQPEQRRRKTLRTLASISPASKAAGTRRHADERLRAVATRAAARLGRADLGTAVRELAAAGESLAAISRRAGLHKDWLGRHLARVDPDIAAELAADGTRTRRIDSRWLPAVRARGFPDVASYLIHRHQVNGRTVHAIASELGVTSGAVLGALRRHGVPVVAHATSRGRAAEREAAVAARFGHPDIGSYLAERRGAGLSWRAIAAECGQPLSWVRRRAAR